MHKVCADLGGVYYSAQQASEHGLIFPTKRDGTVRISEQEAKLLFVLHLASDQRFLFAVETPTVETYKQKGTTPISARVDLRCVSTTLRHQAMAFSDFSPRSLAVC